MMRYLALLLLAGCATTSEHPGADFMHHEDRPAALDQVMISTVRIVRADQLHLYSCITGRVYVEPYGSRHYKVTCR